MKTMKKYGVDVDYGCDDHDDDAVVWSDNDKNE